MTDIAGKHAERKVMLFMELVKLLENHMWSPEIIKEAEQLCGFDIAYHKILFDGDHSKFLKEFEGWQDELMLEQLGQMERPAKIREQIAIALEVRIMQVVSKNVSMNNSAYFLMPSNILAGNESACHTCDLIWKYAGDKSTDFNYYTKRGLLLPVYLSAKSFYFADNSANQEATREFIKNALDNIINIASFKSRINLPKIEDIPILRLFS